MSERRRLLMAQGEEDNPWEKLDYLTIVPLENIGYTVSILPAWYCTEEYDEDYDEYYYYYEYASIEYSVNDGRSWSYVRPYGGEADNISVQAGKTLKLRGALSIFLSAREDVFEVMDVYDYGGTNISVNIEHTLAGSPMSLLNTSLVNAFDKNLRLPEGCFDGLFASNSNLVKILNPKTFLPHETTRFNVYHNMFHNCRKLINAPDLPASYVERQAYAAMFSYCVSLTTLPKLGATIVEREGMANMFAYCSSLTEVPMLSFSVVDYQGAYQMFKDCAALKKVSLNLSSSGNYGFQHMFYRCYSLIEASGQITISSQYSCYGMFTDCSSLVIAPELPSKNAPSGCYNYMFSNCSSLNYIKAMFTVRPAATFLYDWVYGVASTGTFVKNKDATWTNTFGRNAIPTGWTVITE